MKAQVNGICLHYAIEGESGPWITLSHALASDLRTWGPRAVALSARYRVLRFDTRGHGASEARGTPSMADPAGDLAALHAHLGISRSHVVGLSLGGAIAQTCALAHPERVATGRRRRDEHLPVTDPRPVAGAGRSSRGGRHGGRRGRHPPALVHAGVACASSRDRRADGGDDPRDAAGGLRRGRLRHHGVRRPAPPGRDQGPDPRRRRGGGPGAASRALERIAAGIPGARLTVIEDAAHIANVEQPDRVTEPVLDLLDEVDARGR